MNGDKSILPLSESTPIVAFANVAGEDLEKPVEFFRYLAQNFTNDIDFGFIDENISQHDLEAIKSGIDKADVVIFLVLFGSKKSVFNEDLLPVFDALTGKRKSILISNKHIDIKNTDGINLFMQMPDLSEISMVSAIIELSGKNIENNPTK